MRHDINRYELKYLANPTMAAALRAEFGARLDVDPQGVNGTYEVWSLYYDTPSLDFYWEKIDGEKFRRKLRIRHYGAPHGLTGESVVFVEIKQRINRTTQKRRARLTYADARRVCSGQDPLRSDPTDATVIEEVQRLAVERQLRPTVIVGYSRQAYLGRAPEAGLRITIDSHVRGRDRDLDLGFEGAEHRNLIPPMLSILEIKVDNRLPFWLTEVAARQRLTLERVSKYCLCVDAYSGRPRSAFHVPNHEELVNQ